MPCFHLSQKRDEHGIASAMATENEVHDLIKLLDVNKSTGPDGISPNLLKEAGRSIIPSLTRLPNMSLSKSKVSSL